DLRPSSAVTQQVARVRDVENEPPDRQGDETGGGAGGDEEGASPAALEREPERDREHERGGELDSETERERDSGEDARCRRRLQQGCDRGKRERRGGEVVLGGRPLLGDDRERGERRRRARGRRNRRPEPSRAAVDRDEDRGLGHELWQGEERSLRGRDEEKQD